MVSLYVSGSSDFSVIRETAVATVERPCPIGKEGAKVDLVVNGPIVYSYAPAYDHYWFSSVPGEDWFSDYYRTQWGRIAHAPEKSDLASIVKKLLGPFLPLASSTVSLLRGKTINAQRDRVERFTNSDMQRAFASLSLQIPQGGSVIEVGTGEGHFLRPFIKAGCRAQGFEPSPDSAAQARACGVDIIGDFAADDDTTRQAFAAADMVLSNHSLEHHYDPNRLLSLCARYMKPGAVLGITVPNAEAEFLLMAHLFILHLDSYTPVSLECMLNKHGFRVVDREISSQLRFVAVRDTSLCMPAPLQHQDGQRVQAAHHARLLSQLPEEKTFSIKGARPFRGVTFELCEPGDYGSRTFVIEWQKDDNSLIRYLSSSPDNAMLVLK